MVGVLPSRQDVVLGMTEPALPLLGPYVYLAGDDLGHHGTIWGKTGGGKSKLLENVFLQILNKRGGVGVLEPHHDLSFDILTYLVGSGYFRDQRAYKRLIYLDWGNGWFVPFNVLAVPGDPHTIASNALSAMYRVWPELASGAPLFQQLFLCGLMALITNNLPITFLYRVLTDQEFRATCLSRVDDPLVHQVFASYDRLGRDQTQAAGSTLRRAFLLSFSPLARMTLGQPDNWLDFRQIMDRGQSIIINLGNVNDHETRRLLGALLLVQIEQAALSRTDQAPADRRPFTLLVDEWPSFAAQDDTIGAILSQTRKFKLRLHLAAQSLAQVSSERLLGAIENCRITIAFGLGRDSAELQAKHIGKADPFAVKEEALTETQHQTYLSVLEQYELWARELQDLPPRLAYIKVGDQPAVKFKTLTIPTPSVDPVELSEVLATYQRLYQRSPDDARAEIDRMSVLGQTRERDAAGGPRDDAANRPQAPYTILFGDQPVEEVNQ